MPWTINQGDRDPHTKDPTPAEIRRACLAIREGWAPGEERRRALWAFQAGEYTLPTVDYPGDDPLRFDSAPSLSG